MSGQAKEGSNREFFPQLTSVRFFAALIVILYHYDAELKPYLPSLVWNFINHGYVGVSFFFVLSGFVLTLNYIAVDGALTTTKRKFWRARFARGTARLSLTRLGTLSAMTGPTFVVTLRRKRPRLLF